MMRSGLSVFFVLSLSVGVSALTGSSAFAFHTTLEGVCKDIHADRNVDDSSVTAQPKTVSFGTRMKLKFSPEELLGIHASGLASPDKQHRPTLVFSMKPDLKSIPDDRTLLENTREDYVDSLPTQRDLRALVRTRDVAECLKRGQELSISSEKLEAYSKILNRYETYSEEYQANQFQRFAESAVSQYDDGRLFSVSTAEQILDVLAQQPDGKYNLVFVFHADPTGRLYDYSRLIVEQGFFKQVRAKAATIAIFSCYPEAVSHYYSRAIADFERSSVPVFQPELKLEFQTIDAAPIALFEEFARQEQKLLRSAASN